MLAYCPGAIAAELGRIALWGRFKRREIGKKVLWSLTAAASLLVIGCSTPKMTSTLPVNLSCMERSSH